MATDTQDLSRVFARLIAECGLELPALPGTAAEVLALGNQETTDARRLSEVLHRDQGIASHVLRVANSAAHAGSTPCASLQQAVSRLGMRTVGEIAVAVAVRGRVVAGAEHTLLLRAAWRHSVLTAFFTKEIARARRRNVEVAFLCGLLHDVGKAVLLANVARVLGPGEAARPADLLRVVREQHVAAGALLAAHWRLPAEVEQAIRFHHDPEAATGSPDVARGVCLANMIANHVEPTPLGSAPDEPTLRQHPVVAALNLYPDQLDALLALRERALELTEGLS